MTERKTERNESMVKVGGSSGGGDRNYAKASSGMHIAVLAYVYDVGVQTIEWQGESKLKPQLALVWELDEQDENGAPLTMVDKVTSSMAPNARLRQIASALLRAPVEEWAEAETDDWLGKSVVLTIAENKNGNPYIERRDPLQPGVDGITVQGSYGPDKPVHGLVAWHMRKAEEGTVPEGQGIRPSRERRLGERNPDEPKTYNPEPIELGGEAAASDEDMPF